MTGLFEKCWKQIALAACLCLFSLEASAETISAVRLWDAPERTRVVFDLSGPVNYNFFELSNPDRVVIDVDGSKFTGEVPVGSKLGQFVRGFRVGKQPKAVRFVLDLKNKVDPKHFTLGPNELYGDRLVVDLYPETGVAKPKDSGEKPRKNNEFIVVIDAGHGGEDPGAIGAKKTREKTLVLQIAQRLKKAIDAEPGMRAELTRKGDYYIPLRKRTRIAVQENADLFVSIHADAFKKKSAHGISVFALSQRGATSERARVIANKENSSDLFGGTNFGSRDDVLVGVLADLSLTEQIERSLDVGQMVRVGLKNVGPLHGHAVEQAGFVVLKAPSIPSILVEVGFITNPNEERKLKTKQYQYKLVKGIKSAIVQYANKYPWDQERWRSASN